MNPFAGMEHTRSFLTLKKSVDKLVAEAGDKLPDFIAVDPSSTSLGWACYKGGILHGSGTIRASSRKDNYIRLLTIYDKLLPHQDNNVLVLEQIRGNAHKVLHWSVGATITAIRPDYLIEIPYECWKRMAWDGYEKTDENDAILMGAVLVELLRRL